jgi:glycosyltransferase involved in cell wall biosynthesis
MEKISIILATYNSNIKFLKEQLDSITSQSIAPNEIIVRDDCSKNNTVEFLREYAISSPVKINIIQANENSGYAENFTQALRYATGDYIFYSDQDDVWLNTKINDMMEIFMQMEGPLVVITDCQRVDENLNDLGLTTIEALHKRGKSDRYYVHGCGTAFDARLIPLALQRPESLAHDDWIHFIGEKLGTRIVSKKVCHLFRKHEQSATTILKNSANIFTLSNTLWNRLRRRIQVESDLLINKINEYKTLKEGLENGNTLSISKEYLNLGLGKINIKLICMERRLKFLKGTRFQMLYALRYSMSRKHGYSDEKFVFTKDLLAKIVFG